MGSGGMVVKNFIHPLAPYFIYVCGKIQDIPLVLYFFYYCVFVHINYMYLFHYINGPVGHKVDIIQPQE